MSALTQVKGHRARFLTSMVVTIVTAYLSLATNCQTGAPETVSLVVHFESNQTSARVQVSSTGVVPSVEIEADLSLVGSSMSTVAAVSPDGGVPGPTSERYSVWLDCDSTLELPNDSALPILDAGPRCAFDVERGDASEPRDTVLVVRAERRVTCGTPRGQSYAIRIEQVDAD